MNAVEYKSHGVSTPRTEDSPRGEGWKTACNVQPEARPCDGSPTGETGRRDRIIWIQNTTQRHPPFVLPDIHHTDEIMTAILERIPHLNTYIIGVRMSPQQMGATGRRYVSGFLPDDATDIYVDFYLKKHPVY